MRRRDFISLVGVSVATATFPRVALAQQALPLIGRLGNSTQVAGGVSTAGYLRGLADAGFIEGKTVAIEWRWLDGNNDLALLILTDLIQRRVSVLSLSGQAGSLSGGSPFFNAVFASGIPAVTGFARDPRVDGFVANLSRPERNLTGVNQQTKELEPKRLNLLHDIVPKLKTVAYLARPSSSSTAGMIADAQGAAQRLGLDLVVVTADTVAEIDTAFARLRATRPDGLIISADPFFNTQRDQVLGHVTELRLPAVGEWREFAQGGALLGYGTNQDASGYQQGAYAAAILKGAKVADLPVVQLNVYDFVINLKVAQALGLTVPPSILAIATEVIG